MMRRFYLPVAIGALVFAFWLSPESQQIAAGVAIFLFGMMMLEEGFKLVGGGLLERTLEHATRTTPRALLFGVATTTVLQSSSLVSVITISFLGAGLISLASGIAIVFGANIGTTTGAWLVAGFGLKVELATYAMPMIALSIVLVFQKSKALRGIGYALGGIGFLFLGIHYMKEGFDAFKDQIDLARFALSGLAGLVVYTLIGAGATVVMQSSHAAMVLVITALAAGQITYENALALAIGANIGTTVTAIIGAFSSNFQGKRLALAHLIFNTGTAAVALALILPLREAVDLVSNSVGIASDDYTLKLAVFHTIFNMLGVTLMMPVFGRLIAFLERRIVEPEPDVSRPLFLNIALDALPQTLEAALRKEVRHLHDNAVGLILRGLNIHPETLRAADNIADAVRRSRRPIDVDLDEEYERRVKTLYSAIVDFTTRVGDKRLPADIAEQVYALRDVSSDIVRAVKSVKHLRKNVLRYASRPQGRVTELYDALRIGIARIIAGIRDLEDADPRERSTLWLDHERAQIEEHARSTTRELESMIRRNELSATAATSFLNDSGYAYGAMRQLVDAARSYYAERDTSMAEVERILQLEDEEFEEAGAAGGRTGDRHGEDVK